MSVPQLTERMLPLRVFVVGVEPFVNVGDNGKLQGPLATYYFKFYYFLNKFNCSFFTIPEISRIIDREVQAQRINAYMQSENIDLSIHLSEYSKFLPNTTIGPVLEEHECVILSCFPLPRQYNDFINTFNSVDRYFMVMFTLTIFILTCFYCSLRPSEVLSTFWLFYQTFARNAGKRLSATWSRKVALTTFAVFILFLHIISTANINTNFISTDSYRRIDSIHEIVQLEAIPYSFALGTCGISLKTVNEGESQAIASKLRYVPPSFEKLKENLVEMIRHKRNRVFIGDSGEISMCEEIMCLRYADHMEGLNWPAVSAAPIFSRLRNNINNVNSPGKLRITLNSYIYHRYEMGLDGHFYSSQLIYQFLREKASTRCLNRLSQQKLINSPIPLTFFRNTLTVAVGALMTSIIIFALELMQSLV